MGTNTGDLYVNLRADVKELKKGLKQANSSLKKFDKDMSKNRREAERFKKSMTSAGASLLKFGAGAVAINKISGAFKALLVSSFNYNKDMEDSTIKLRAMISASKDYETISGRLVGARERERLITKETAETMKLLKSANKETAMGMQDLINTYALMKPQFDQVNVGVKDQVEILKLVTNTASTFGLSAQELSTGVDDLAKGTYKTTQSFGKMMTAIGVSREELKTTTDVVGYLKDKMKETGIAQDSMATATSNFSVAWGEMTGELTKPIFGKIKESVKELTRWLGEEGVKASKAFSVAVTEFAKGAVKVIGFVLKAVNQLIHAFALAYKGYQQLGNEGAKAGNKIGKVWNETAVAVGEFFGMDTSEDKKDLEGYTRALKARQEMTKQLSKETQGLVESNNAINDSISKVVTTFVEYEAKVEEVTKSTEKLKQKTKELNKEANKGAGGKGRKKTIKKVKDDSKRLADAFKSSLGDMFDALFNGDMVGAFASGMESIKVKLKVPDFGDAFGEMLDGFLNGFKNFSETMDNIIKASVWGLILSVGVKLLNSFMGGNAPTPPKLGDVHMISPSLENALKDIKDVQYPLLKLTKSMNDHLSKIALAFGGVENSLLRSGIDLGGDLYQDSSKSGFLFGNTERSLYGTSISISAGNIESLMNGQITAMLDTVTKKVKTSWWGKKKTHYYHEFTNIGKQISGYISQATTEIFKSFSEIGKALGISTAGLKSAQIDIGKIETTGMSSEEIASEIQGRFSAEIDGIAESLFSEVKEFQRAGEGLSETAYRVALTFDQVSHAMDLLNKSVTWQTANIIADSAGGIDSLMESLIAFNADFFTDDERLVKMQNTLSKSFATLGVSMPKTNKEFRALVDGIDTMTRSGAKLFGEVIGLSGSFSEMTELTKNLADAQMEIKMEIAEKELSFYENILKRVTDAWTGALSYLTNSEKSLYLGNLANSQLSQGNTAGYLDSLSNKLKYDMKMAVTKEDYIPKFNAYLEKLSEQVPQKTTDDVVETLQDILDAIMGTQTAITVASYQTPLKRNI